MVNIKQKPHLHASWIDRHARDIVGTLQREGFTTYLVGGCVRDLLAGIHPKDFDIATDAEPNQIKRKIWGSYVIGKRFRLVLVKRDGQQFEVATFRREASPTEQQESEELKLGDNFFGTPEQDALRRDFTINALFYDPIKDVLIDYSNGQKDVDARILRMIGDPVSRIIEDPIRSLRAVRLSHKLRFKIEESLRAAIQERAADIALSVLPRRREEYLKILKLQEPLLAWLELHDLGILHHIIPTLAEALADAGTFEAMLPYLMHSRSFVSDWNRPEQVFLPVILGYIRACSGTTGFNEKLERLMRDELGIFKAEQAQILSAIELSEHLESIEVYKRRGQRRQIAFLRSEGFTEAIRIAELETLLDAPSLAFWNQELTRLSSASAN